MTTSQTTHIDDQEGGRPKPRILGDHRLVLPARRWLDLLSSAIKKDDTLIKARRLYQIITGVFLGIMSNWFGFSQTVEGGIRIFFLKRS